MPDIAVIDDPAAAEASLDPVRATILAALRQPGSASSLAAHLGMPRQKVNYHLRTLERHGLVELVEERRKGNMNERVMRASAGSFVISPVVLQAAQPDPAATRDQLSAHWLLAVAAKLLSDVGTLIGTSTRARKRLATFALDAEVRFASAGERAAFAEELSAFTTDLVARYHDESAPGGRDHRLVLAVHPQLARKTGKDS